MGSRLFGRRGTKRAMIDDQINANAAQGRLQVVGIAPPTQPQTLTWDRDKSRFPPGFYAYRLIDPKSGLPFYVGKGQRHRAWQHESAVKRGDYSGNVRKVDTIKGILQRGDEIGIEIVACYELESDALDHEFRLVDATPTLTNIVAGGGGAPLSREHQARRIAVRAEKLRRLREAEAKAAAEARRTALLGVAASTVERDEIANWLDGLSGDDEKKLKGSLEKVAQVRASRSKLMVGSVA